MGIEQDNWLAGIGVNWFKSDNNDSNSGGMPGGTPNPCPSDDSQQCVSTQAPVLVDDGITAAPAPEPDQGGTCQAPPPASDPAASVQLTPSPELTAYQTPAAESDPAAATGLDAKSKQSSFLAGYQDGLSGTPPNAIGRVGVAYSQDYDQGYKAGIEAKYPAKPDGSTIGSPDPEVDNRSQEDVEREKCFKEWVDRPGSAWPPGCGPEQPDEEPKPVAEPIVFD